MIDCAQEVCAGLKDASYDIDEKYLFLNVDDIPPLDLELNIETSPIEPELGSSDESPRTKVEKQITQKKKGTRGSVKLLPSLPQIDSTWGNYNWQCQYCESFFPTVTQLKIHGIEVHESCNPYKCTDCNIRKAKLDCFVTHITTHKKYLKYSCYMCYEKFSEISQTKLHYKTHAKSKHACSGCNESFETADELDQHNLAFKRDTQTKQAPRANLNENLCCHVCKKTFKHKRSLSSHLLTHTNKKPEHTCERCGKTYVTKQGLNVHLMAHDDIRPFPCLICKLRFRTNGQLRVHVRVHDDVKPFECHVCGKRFRLSNQLVNHFIIHTDNYPYTCPLCSKKFRFKNFISEHMRQHTGIKPYCCDICDKKFASWANYDKHMKVLHNISIAKRKRTAKGICPIDPNTGEVVLWEESIETNAWKKELLNVTGKRGRPKNTQYLKN